MFKADNPDYKIVPKAKKQVPFELTCLWGPTGTRIASRDITLCTATTGATRLHARALAPLMMRQHPLLGALAAQGHQSTAHAVLPLYHGGSDHPAECELGACQHTR